MKRFVTTRATAPGALAAWGLAWLFTAVAVQAEPEARSAHDSAADPPPTRSQPGAAAGAAGAGPAPAIGLDRLLRLPSAGPPGTPGAPVPTRNPDRNDWEQRFAAAREKLGDTRSNLASTQQQLEELASKSESWQMAAPGAQASAEGSPLSYKLRQDIRYLRDEVVQAERELQELEVEASLAGVPPEWRRAPDATNASDR